MIIRRRRSRQGRVPTGFYRFENMNHRSVSGFGDGDYVRLRDEHGNEWRGTAESQGENTVRYRFRDAQGHLISGISDSSGIVLRDEKGNTWRGFVY